MKRAYLDFSQTTEKQPWEEPTIEFFPWRDIITED
jgi:hypothetical protein